MRRAILFGCLLQQFPSQAQVLPFWSNIYQQAPNKHHYLNDMEVNSEGDIWMYGVATDTIGWRMGMVVKYSGQGFVQDWAVEFLDYGQLTDIDIDDSNYVYVGTTDYDTIGSTGSNYLTKKISPSGMVEWSATYSGIGPNNLDRASALCVDGQGNVMITGFGDRPDYKFDWFTVKYDGNGNQLWVAQHSPPTDFGGTYGGVDIAIDAADNIYVTGLSHDTINGDFATIKYAPDGTQLWIRREGGSHFSFGRVIRVKDDRVYVGGHFTHNDLDSSDVLVACYDTAGSHLWTTVYNAPPFFNPPWYNGRETLEDLQIDDLGNVYFTGTEFATNGSRDDYMIVKLDPNGDVVWGQHYGAGTGWDDARSMFVDAQGSVYVTGRSEGAPEGISVVHTVKFDLNGTQLWYSPFSTALFDYHYPGEIRWDGGNFFYVGASRNSTNGGQLILLGYWITTGIPQFDHGSQIAVFPNPASDLVQVDLSDRPGQMQVAIIDASGRTVLSEALVGGGLSVLQVAGLTSGAYCLRVMGDGDVTHGRLVIE
ncbi:MAG: T9SS type A sorting domain-containing protein [Flavobacteriales bacterium]|nr:T9SS type A sorting domain-containing protein [Flavobacteriales bacterium]